MVRVKDETEAAIKIIAGKLQAQSARDTSADDAIWHMVERLYPEVVEDARRIVKETATQKKTEKPG